MPSVTLEKTMSLHAAVGRVASKWAQLEHHIQEPIWGLAGLDAMIGTCITSQIGNSGLLMNALLALLEQKGASEEKLKPLRSLYEKIGEKQRMRNPFTIPGIFISTTTGRLRVIGSSRAPSKRWSVNLSSRIWVRSSQRLTTSTCN
jgi:hypothetical protein